MVKDEKAFNKMLDAIDLGNHKCFQEHKTEDGKCYGLTGGDRSTNFLNYGCIGCTYLTVI